MPTSANFVPNTSCGPCIYCGEKKDGKPEEFLKCQYCKQTAHLECLKSGKPQNRLMGDNFFSFTCLYCSLNNEESVTRVNISILHAMLIAMYNLYINHSDQATEGHFHYKKDIHAFMVNHWQELFAFEGKKMSFKDKTRMPPSCISGQLSQAPFFRAKRTGRGGWYRLVSIKCPAELIEIYGPKRKLIDSAKEDSKRAKNSDLTSKGGKFLNGFTVKSEGGSEDSTLDSFDDNSSRGSWFTDRSFITPMQSVPFSIFEDDDEDDVKKSDSSKFYFKNFSQQTNGTGTASTKSSISYFSDIPASVDESTEITSYLDENKAEDFSQMSRYEENNLLNQLDNLNAVSTLSPRLYRLRRKLKVRRQKREHGLPIFNLDEEVKYIEKNGRVMTNSERLSFQTQQDYSNINASETNNVLDRFQIWHRDDKIFTKDNNSFKVKLVGSPTENLAFIHSPYSLKNLKPYIFRDPTLKPSKLKLLEDIISYPHKKSSSWKPPPQYPIDYCYVTHKHIPAMNQLARQFFWPGIELSEVLRYPDFTCVVLYGKLVIGFGIVVPDAKHNEAYLSFLLVHPEWRRAGIAKFMLYHLLQTCSGKDVTLHVSATNPASIMYQQFGFKVEEFLLNFYDKYFPEESCECKHAMFLRLSR